MELEKMLSRSPDMSWNWRVLALLAIVMSSTLGVSQGLTTFRDCIDDIHPVDRIVFRRIIGERDTAGAFGAMSITVNREGKVTKTAKLDYNYYYGRAASNGYYIANFQGDSPGTPSSLAKELADGRFNWIATRSKSNYAMAGPGSVLNLFSEEHRGSQTNIPPRDFGLSMNGVMRRVLHFGVDGLRAGTVKWNAQFDGFTADTENGKTLSAKASASAPNGMPTMIRVNVEGADRHEEIRCFYDFNPGLDGFPSRIDSVSIYEGKPIYHVSFDVLELKISPELGTDAFAISGSIASNCTIRAYSNDAVVTVYSPRIGPGGIPNTATRPFASKGRVKIGIYVLLVAALLAPIAFLTAVNRKKIKKTT